MTVRKTTLTSLIALLCAMTASPATAQLDNRNPAVPTFPWTERLDLRDGNGGTWTMVVSRPPSDADRPATGFPVLLYLDNGVSRLVTDTARRIGGRKNQVLAVGLIPPPGKAKGPVGWPGIAKIRAMLGPGAGCATLLASGPQSAAATLTAVRDAELAGLVLAYPFPGDAPPQTIGKADMLMLVPAGSSSALMPQAIERGASLLELGSTDRLLSEPEVIVRALEWASTRCD